MEPEILIKCQGATEVTLDELHELHQFKTQSDAQYAKCRNVLIERGFKFPFSIWIDSEGNKWTVDGHQRLKTLKRMQSEGYPLPQSFPSDIIQAENKADAAKDIIASESKFAEIDPSSFTEFLGGYEIKWEDVENWANIPDLELTENNGFTPDGGSKKQKEVECPSCKFTFTP